MSNSASLEDSSTLDSVVDGQLDLFGAGTSLTRPQRNAGLRWQEFDDVLEQMGSLRLNERMKELAIAPVLLDELSCARDDWRWPSTLDTVDLLYAKHSPTREKLGSA
jgi:hypothetical protein